MIYRGLLVQLRNLQSVELLVAEKLEMSCLDDSRKFFLRRDVDVLPPLTMEKSKMRIQYSRPRLWTDIEQPQVVRGAHKNA